MSDPTKRLEAWKAKATPERTKQALEARHEDMQRRYHAAMVEMTAMETEVRTILNHSGIHTSAYVPYLNYGRQLWKLFRTREISGDSFALAAKVLAEKWASRGCNPDVLSEILTQVFNTRQPTP